MARKIFTMVIIWCAVVFAYIFLGFIMPFYKAISTNTSAALTASANMSQFPGTKEAIDSMPVWVWFIPGAVGVVATVIELRSKE